ncbi:MAG: hypothetical protein HY718_22075 [Planctomycetes bacterium]|nr:hypothetical protein [Planctomycetota bacterium]
MIRRKTAVTVGVVVLSTTVGASAQTPTIHEATGANAAAIQTEVDAFRTELGTLNANGPGSVGSGRREINWDAVPDADAAPGRFPGNFFNQNTNGLARGVEFTTPGILSQVSADAVNPTATPVRFDNLNATYSTAFAAFSPERLFAPLVSNLMDVTFFVPGSTTPAVTRGFGVVFTDVDTADAASMDFFDAGGNLLLSRNVLPTAGNASLSFLGVSFADAVIARVHIVCGKAAAGATDVTQDPVAGSDVVVMDDWILGEPVALPTISVSDVTVTEGNAGTVDATFTLTLSTATTQAVTVDVATADSTATTADNDYTQVAETVTFGPATAQTTATVTVPVNGDTKFEPDEVFFLLLSNPVNAMLADDQAVATITNDDTAPTISVNDQQVTEGAVGARIRFTVSLSNASHQTVTVAFSTADVTAVAGQDYNAASGTLTFFPGQTSQDIDVLVRGDTEHEANETFTLNLTSPTNAAIADAQGVGTIVDDDVDRVVVPLCAGGVGFATIGTLLGFGVHLAYSRRRCG